MTFKLSTSGSFYSDQDKARYERLGFSFEPNDAFPDKPWIKTWGSTSEIEINTIEALLAFVREQGQVIVSNGELEIYDDYRE